MIFSLQRPYFKHKHKSIAGVVDTTTDQSVVDYASKYGTVSAYERSPDCVLVQFSNK